MFNEHLEKRIYIYCYEISTSGTSFKANSNIIPKIVRDTY